MLICAYCRVLFKGTDIQAKLVQAGDSNVWCSIACTTLSELERQNWVRLRMAQEAKTKQEREN